MVLFTRLHASPLLNKMALLKESIVILLKLLIFLVVYCRSKRVLGKPICIVFHVVNRISSSITSWLSPFETIYVYVPNYSFLKVFDSTYFVLLPQVEHSKFFHHYVICIFLGYGDDQNSYHCYNPINKKCMFLVMLCFLNTYHFTGFGFSPFEKSLIFYPVKS